MKKILARAMQSIEYALDSGLLISEDFEQAVLLDEVLSERRNRSGKYPVDRS